MRQLEGMSNSKNGVLRSLMNRRLFQVFITTLKFSVFSSPFSLLSLRRPHLHIWWPDARSVKWWLWCPLKSIHFLKGGMQRLWELLLGIYNSIKLHEYWISLFALSWLWNWIYKKRFLHHSSKFSSKLLQTGNHYVYPIWVKII